MDFGIASVAAITVIAYLVGIGCKAAGSVKDELIPVICGCVGAVLGIAGLYLMPDFPAKLRGYGEIGRRAGFRFLWATVWVQIPLSAPLKIKPNLIGSTCFLLFTSFRFISFKADIQKKRLRRNHTTKK